MTPILLGYFPKRVAATPEWMSKRGIAEIGSVSLCIAGGPDGWLERWKHNEWGFFASPAIAWSLVPSEEQEGFRLYAYALHPVEFGDREEKPMGFPPPGVSALGPEYERVGWDVVSRSGGAHFDCSPLSCNLLAEELATNRYCLFSDLARALELARSAHGRRCEPGPYHVVEVWRRRGEIGHRG